MFNPTFLIIDYYSLSMRSMKKYQVYKFVEIIFLVENGSIWYSNDSKKKFLPQ